MRIHPRRWSPIAIAVLMTSATLAGCGSSDKGSAMPTPSTVSYAEMATEPVERCGYPAGTKKVVVTTPDGVKLAGAEVGAGPSGVVLLHQRSADLCGWSTYVDAFVDKGLHVLAIDLRCNGMSDCSRESIGDTFDQQLDYAADAGAAVAFLHNAGATKVAVMGASMGAVTAVVAGGRFADQIDAVVGLSVFNATWNASGNTLGVEIKTPTQAVPKTRAPILIAVGGRDVSGSITAAGAAALLSEAPAKAKSKVVDRPDSGAHGWNLLNEGVDNVEPDVLAFLTANLG
jgi:dienelactone hydrolase